MVPICSHCPNCSNQWSLVVLTAVPNAPICSTQLSPLQRPIVPTAAPNSTPCSAQPSAVPKASICSAQWSRLQCPIAHHLHCPMLQFEVPYGPNCSAQCFHLQCQTICSAQWHHLHFPKLPSCTRHLTLPQSGCASISSEGEGHI